jgi:malonate transporter
MSFSHIFTIVVPVFLVIALGYGAGRGTAFSGERADALRVLTMDFALPASLFLGIANTPRHILLSQGPLVGMLALGLLGLFGLILLALRLIGRLPLRRASILALASVQPQYAFMGVTILGNLFGEAKAAIPIAIAGILVNVALDPLVLILLNLGRTHVAEATAPASAPAPSRVLVSAGGGPAAAEEYRDGGAGTTPPAAATSVPAWVKVLGPLRRPFAWAPLLGLVVAMTGVRPPEMIETSLSLVGQAASGVALLSVGVTLARVGRPQFSLGAIGIALTSVAVLPLSMYGIGLLLTSHEVAAQTALILAFPVSPVPMMLASQHVKSEEHRVASSVIISIVMAFASLPLIINLTG